MFHAKKIPCLQVCWTAFVDLPLLIRKCLWFMTKQNLSYQSSRISQWLWLKRKIPVIFYWFWPHHHDPNLSVLPEIKKKMRHITGYIPHINHSHHPLLLAVRWLCGVNMSLIYWQRLPTQQQCLDPITLYVLQHTQNFTAHCTMSGLFVQSVAEMLSFCGPIAFVPKPTNLSGRIR